MDKTTLDSVNELLESYQSLKYLNQSGKYQLVADGLFRMRDALAELRRTADLEQHHQASRFNIFTLLGVQDDEVRTHSRLLRELLSPNGSHAQGVLFLEKFLEMTADLDEEFSMPAQPLVEDHWNVRAELHTGSGNIDLAILSRVVGRLVVIENKVWADEQANQLARYADWMRQRRQEFPHQILIYLTRGGWESVTANQARYLRLSYREDIAGWLERCLPEIRAMRVAETIRQYQDVIRKL